MTGEDVPVFWTPRALQDLKSIAAHIASDSPLGARGFAAKLKSSAEALTRFPRRGRMMPELDRGDVREIIEGNYRIVYRIRYGAVDILTIFEGHRRFVHEEP